MAEMYWLTFALNMRDLTRDQQIKDPPERLQPLKNERLWFQPCCIL